MHSKTAQAHPTTGTQESANPAIGEGHNLATVVALNKVQNQPVTVDCPICHQRALTTIAFKSGNTTIAWALGLSFFLGVSGSLVPFLVRGTKDIIHKCGRCERNLARWHRSRGHAVDVLAFN